MITFKIADDFDKLANTLGVQQRQVRYAAAVSITRTAQDVRADEYEEMRKVFDRPTRYTLNSLFLSPATPANLTATVYLKDTEGAKRGHYLLPQIQGAGRVLKTFEVQLQRIGVLPPGMFAVPASGAKFDAFGNMQRTQLIQILAYLQAFGEQGYKANTTAARRAKLARGSKKTQGMAYFVSGREKGKSLPLGIWQRTHFAKGTAIRPILLFYRQVRYRPIFAFYTTAQRTTRRVHAAHFTQAFNDALATAR